MAEAPADPVAEQEARGEKGQRGADRRGKGNDDGAPEQAEYGATGEGQQRCAGQRERGDRDVGEEIEAGNLPRVLPMVIAERRLLRLQRIEAEVLAESELEVGDDGDDDQGEDDDLLAVHADSSVGGRLLRRAGKARLARAPGRGWPCFVAVAGRNLRAL
ncbi:MAG: hypothetical protein AW08_02053 [Candidatus Accumulibacter adjunctus]|uniref:Uncharacterized protein n=1 Tax=Candidatus Accumulibacter adjunctus TaxID=1454001 RepID=A0A011NSG7_9PROT|nr:MAG: hypothetical protein AW08_02053 [Candidatus Accumulibacter adjunctus]